MPTIIRIYRMEVNMFRRRSFFFRALLVLIVLGGFAATGMLAYRAGAAHGYAQAAAAVDESRRRVWLERMG